MSEVEPDAEFAPGTVLLDKYRVLRTLGVGGMSRVLAAEHLTLGTKVAIKVLLPALAALPDAPQRFAREALAATKIPSDHVARVLDVGTLPAPGPGADTPYMVMEHLDGRDLGRMVREGKRFSIEEAIELMVQAADALSLAHAAGVVHRDVKPSNLFLTRRSDGSPLVKVLDFGISKLVLDAAADDLALTKTTAVMGSALYMSLEQMRSTKTVDRRTDVWALGVSLYELLTGTHPWTAETFSELCVKVSLDPPDPLRSHRSDVPEALADALEIAYARKPEERYQTVGQMIAALERFAASDTKKHIRRIRERERASHPDLADPVRPSRPPRLGWAGYAIIAGAGLAAVAALGWTWQPAARGPLADAGVIHAAPVDAAEIDAHTDEDAGVIVAATDAGLAIVDAGAATVDAGRAITDAGATRADAGAPVVRPQDLCRGKAPGATVILPGGMRWVCN